MGGEPTSLQKGMLALRDLGSIFDTSVVTSETDVLFSSPVRWVGMVRHLGMTSDGGGLRVLEKGSHPLYTTDRNHSRGPYMGYNIPSLPPLILVSFPNPYFRRRTLISATQLCITARNYLSIGSCLFIVPLFPISLLDPFCFCPFAFCPCGLDPYSFASTILFCITPCVLRYLSHLFLFMGCLRSPSTHTRIVPSLSMA